LGARGCQIPSIVPYSPLFRSHKETGLRGTIGNGPGLGENVDGLRSGDQVAREQGGPSPTAAGEIVSVCQDWQRIAVASGNGRRIVNYWCWVDRHKETGLRRTIGNRS